MNLAIRQYFDAIETCLIESPVIVSYRILSQEVTPVDGKLRIKAETSNGGQAEFFVYVAESAGDIHTLKYSFHWQDAQGQLIRRWDNAPHFPDLLNTPHHVHEADGTVSELAHIPEFSLVIEEMERTTPL
ncbi:MAG: hypothetical protein HYW07_06885 [Candidatus Latescibacteria bacterium]|nr:hypothetical protein [Candidatus Latescibacterota bacterium]